MQVYLAPLEGITTYVYRKAYNRYFGGVDRYFTPFIVNKKLAKKEIEGILPENNPDMVLVPQIMSNRAEDFIEVARVIATYGYDTVNLNLGCPSGTVVSKKRGAGFLACPDELDVFLSEVYEKCPMKISIKTRIGLEAEKEWGKILSIYEKYPMEELIIHPRLRSDFYKGPIRMEAFGEAIERINVPICYNGELNSVADAEQIKDTFPQIDRVMIGRGVLRRPDLILQIRGEKVSEEDMIKRLSSFHDEIFEGYRNIMSGDRNTLFKMKELWSYMGESFEGADTYLKQIKKANRLIEYENAVNAIFRDCSFPKTMVKF